MKIYQIILFLNILACTGCTQKLNLKNQSFELKNVTGSIVDLKGEKVLKVERDLKALPFDNNNLVATVDAPTYAKLDGVDFENGTIEVKVLSRIQKNSPYKDAWGFIGVAFRVDNNDSAYESFYVRPKDRQVS